MVYDLQKLFYVADHHILPHLLNLPNKHKTFYLKQQQPSHK
jgi:hypothetical protein